MSKISPQRQQEELDSRRDTVEKYINKFLAGHSFISSMAELNKYMFDVVLTDGRALRIFATNTYHLTEYTVEKVLTMDPGIDAIVCSNPYGQYSNTAKRICIENEIGLFSLGEFMGAIRKKGDLFLNYLSSKESTFRLEDLKRKIRKSDLGHPFQIFIFGSYLRSKIYNDLDLYLVFPDDTSSHDIEDAAFKVRQAIGNQSVPLDMVCGSHTEYSGFRLDLDNRVRIL
jgi:hypothetical protein